MSDPKNANTSGISILSEDDFSELAQPHPALVMGAPPESASTASTSSPLQGLKTAMNKQTAQTLPPLQPIGGKQPAQPAAAKPSPLQPLGGKMRPVTPQPAVATPKPAAPTITPAAATPVMPNKVAEVKPVTPVTPTPVQPIKAEEVKPATPEPAKVEPVKVEPVKAEEVKPVEPAKVEPVKVEPVKAEEVKPVEPAKVEPVKVEPVKAEPAKAEVKAEEKPAEEPKAASILTEGKINDKKVPMIAPPAMLGILGGGQLGRFFAMAAKRMGYKVTVLDPDPDAPAADFADEHICAAYDDEAALEKLAQCAAVTTEFENVNAAAMTKLAQKTRVTPAGELVAIAQNRIDEKATIRKASLPVTPYQAIRSREDLNENTKQLLPGILKTATLGYDGKGQRSVKTQTGLLTCLSSLAKDGPYILEKELDLRAELSVIVCRLDNNIVVTFPPAENIHDNGILAFSIVPARLPEELTKRAEVMAKHLAEKLDYVGVLAVEMFVVGDKQQLVVNEIAPRPHNSGHYTMDACVSDQFQQQVRIMCGLPPSRTSLIHPCCMVNLLGDMWGENGEEPDWTPLLKNPDTFLHLYGKKEARPGRKMGHFTVFAETAEAAYEKAQNLFTSVCLGS